MDKYNEKFIDSFNEDKYLLALSDYQTLLSYYETSLKRYDKNKDKKSEGEYFLLLESIDHYVTKKFLTNRNFPLTIAFDNYLKFLKKVDFSKSSYVFNNNFINNVDNATLVKLLGQEKVDEINNFKERGLVKIKEIMEKVYKNASLTQDELNLVCDYYTFNRSEDDTDHRELVKYIFNNLTKPDSHLTGSSYVNEAVASYLPKYFKYYDQEKADDVRVAITSNYVKVAGSTNNHIILLSSDYFNNVDFKHSDDVKRSFSATGNDFTYLLFIMYHEIFHQDQLHLSNKNNFYDYGYSFIISQILQNEYKDYRINHDNDEIEIDASERGWIECIKFYNDFIADQDLRQKLINNCSNNAIETSYRRSFATKKDKSNRIMDADLYDVEKVSKIVKEKPEYLELYPMLRTFYNANGDMNLSFIVDPKIKDTAIGQKYIRYACLKQPTELLEKITKANSREIKTGVYNLCKTASDEMQRKEKSSLAQKDKASIEYQINELPEITKNRNTRIIVRNCLKILIKPTILVRHPIKIGKTIKEIADKLEDINYSEKRK